MKIIKYKFLSAEVNHGTEENPNIKNVFVDKFMSWNKANEEIAKREAYNGEYTIEDDGVEETIESTPEERIAELEEALDMLLNGVTE